MLLHYEILIHTNVTLALHAKLSLSRDCYCKTHVNQCLFPFSYLSRKDSCFSLTCDYISENRYVKITSGYWFGRENWVIRTLLLSQCIESHMATGVPSQIISMTWPWPRRSVPQWTQHVNKVPGCNRGINESLGCVRDDLDRFFSRDQAQRYLLMRPLRKVTTGLRKTSVFWQ